MVASITFDSIRHEIRVHDRENIICNNSLLMQLSDQAEIVIVISANDIDKNKVRGDLGITYDEDVLRLMDEFTSRGLYVGSVCITQYSGQESADLFKKRLEKLGIRVYKLYLIPGYPSNTSFIVSDEGYGKNDYTTKLTTY